MRKFLTVPALCAAAAIVCTACAHKPADYTASSEEIQVPDDVEVPDAASAVESIINQEDIVDIPEMDEDALEELESGEEKPQVEVTIYYVQGDYDSYRTETAELDEDYTVDDVLGRLAVHNIVPLDCKAVSSEITEKEDGTAQMSLDLPGKFGVYLDTMSDEASDAVVCSLADTMIEAFDVDSVCLTSDGNPVGLSGEEDNTLVWTDVPAN